MKHLHSSGFQYVEDIHNNVAGTNVDNHFATHWSRSNCLIVLLNADFLAEMNGPTRFNFPAQFTQRLPAFKKDGVPLYSILVGACGWRYAPEFSGCQVFTGLDGKPLNMTNDRDAFWLDFCEQMHQDN